MLLCSYEFTLNFTEHSQNEAEMKTEINNIEAINSELENEVEKRQSTVDQLSQNLEGLTADVPGDLPDILWVPSR